MPSDLSLGMRPFKHILNEIGKYEYSQNKEEDVNLFIDESKTAENHFQEHAKGLHCIQQVL